MIIISSVMYRFLSSNNINYTSSINYPNYVQGFEVVSKFDHSGRNGQILLKMIIST